MGKYDMPLDLLTDNALAIIVAHISKGSLVLEFGPANGRLTRYLHDELKCKVDIVEIDEEAGREAAAYARHACIGTDDGDIERYSWIQAFDGNKYDYVLFTDVLEHLRDPMKALKRCAPFLKESGEIIASVPNIAHNAILIELMNDRFNYTDVGLLDNTHIHFFTYSSFVQLAEWIGYRVVEAEASLAALGSLEIPSTYEMVPRSVARFLKQRERGSVYQYVFRLKRITGHGRDREVQVRRVLPLPSYYCECYVRSEGMATWTEGQRQLRGIHGFGIGAELEVEFDLTGYDNIVQLRIDPLNVSCVLIFKYIILQYEDVSETVDDFLTNGTRIHESYIFSTDDPQVILDVKKRRLRQLRICFSVKCFDDDMIVLFEKYVAEIQVKLQEQQEQLQRQLREQLQERMCQYNETMQNRNLWCILKDYANRRIFKRREG